MGTRLETKHPFKHEGIDWLRFTHDGKYLVTGSDDGWVKGWEVPEFYWSRHLPGFWGVGSVDGGMTQSWTDSITETDSDGNVTQKFPDGTVKRFRQQ